MILDIQIKPESEEEVQFLEKLTAAREFGIDETDLTRAELASIYSEFAAGIASEIDVDRADDSYLTCPVCNTVVDDVTAEGLGGDPIVEPCGCTVEWNELPDDIFGGSDR